MKLKLVLLLLALVLPISISKKERSIQYNKNLIQKREEIKKFSESNCKYNDVYIYGEKNMECYNIEKFKYNITIVPSILSVYYIKNSMSHNILKIKNLFYSIRTMKLLRRNIVMQINIYLLHSINKLGKT